MKVLAVLENLTSFGTIMNQINSNFSDIKQAIDALEEGAETGGSGGSGIILVDGVPGAEIEAPVDALALDVVAGGLYRKSEEDWTFVLSMKGTNGVDGSQWSCGSVPPSENAAIVPKVNDFYLNTTTYDVSMFNGVEWVWQCNIKGAPGDSGGGTGGTGADGKSAYELYVENFVPETGKLKDYLQPNALRDITEVKKLSFSNNSVGVDGTGSSLGIILETTDFNVVHLDFTDESITIYDSFSGTTTTILNSDIIAGTQTSYEFSINNRLYDGMPVTFKKGGLRYYNNNGVEPLTYINTDIITEALGLTEWLASLKGRDGKPGKDGKSAYELYVEKNAYKPVEAGKVIELFPDSPLLFVTKDILNANDTASVTLRDANGETYIINVEPNIQDNVQTGCIYADAISGFTPRIIEYIMNRPYKMIPLLNLGPDNYPITIESVEGKEAFYIRDTEGLLTEDQWIERLSSDTGGDTNKIVDTTTTFVSSANKLYGIAVDSTDEYGNIETPTGSFPCVAIGVEDGDKTKLVFNGVISNKYWRFTPGAVLYAGNDGYLTETKPTTVGNTVQVVGVAITAKKILFRPELTFTVVE